MSQHIQIKINTLDIETYIHKGKFIPYCLCFSIDNSFFSIYSDDVILSFLNKVISTTKSDYIVFYIHNLNFDGMLFIDYLSFSKIKYEVLSVNTDLYWLKIFYSGYTLLLRCSYKIIRLPLRQIGLLENYPKQFFPYKFVTSDTLNYVGDIPSQSYWESNDYLSFLESNPKLPYDLKNEAISYCIQDIKILHKCLSSLLIIINEINNKVIDKHFSIPSISHFIFFKNFNSKDIPQSILVTHDSYIRPFFYGGRCEVFSNLDDDEHIKYYDFTGMYSQCMLQKFPTGKPSFSVPNDFNKPGFYNIDFFSDMFYPILPYKSNKGKLLFPNGNLTGTYWYEEILYFIENGGKVNKINNALTYDSSDYIFENFVSFFSAIRKKGGYYNIFGKNVLNSFYGSTALRNKETLTYISFSSDEVDFMIRKLTISKIVKINSATLLVIEKDHKYLDLYGKDRKNNTKRNISIAASISSKARIKLHKLFIEIEKDGGRMLYCDTDSAFAAYKTHDKREYIADKKWLNFYKDGFFAAPKSYALLSDSSVDIKLKGISRKDISFSDLKLNFLNSDRIQFNHQKISSKSSFTLKETVITKTLDFSKYDKRIFSPDKKRTTPITHI